MENRPLLERNDNAGYTLQPLGIAVQSVIDNLAALAPREDQTPAPQGRTGGHPLAGKLRTNTSRKRAPVPTRRPSQTPK
jgi:hypothetical protein